MACQRQNHEEPRRVPVPPSDEVVLGPESPKRQYIQEAVAESVQRPLMDPVTGKIGEEDGKWWWFNDDKVTEVTSDKIDALAGGGESHSALILLYKAIPLPTAEGVME